MKNVKNVFFALSLLALTACGGESETVDKNVLMHTDFDSLNGWIPASPSLTKERAHSGQYSLKVDKGQEFSLTYSAALGQLSSSRIRSIRVDAWVYLTNKDAKARWGVITKEVAGGKDLSSDGFDLQSQVKEFGKWTKVSQEFKLPAEATYTSQLVMFMWGPGLNVPVFVDDMQVTALN